MKIWKAILYALSITAISVGLLTLVRGLPTRDQLIEGALTMFFVAFVVMKCFGGGKEKDYIVMDEKWKKLNEEGKCGKCKKEFTAANHDGGGGMCRNCWARSH